jgi:hypothetical protein
MFRNRNVSVWIRILGSVSVLLLQDVNRLPSAFHGNNCIMDNESAVKKFLVNEAGQNRFPTSNSWHGLAHANL